MQYNTKVLKKETIQHAHADCLGRQTHLDFRRNYQVSRIKGHEAPPAKIFDSD